MTLAKFVAVALLALILIPAPPPGPSLGPNRAPTPPVIQGPPAVTAALGVNISFTANTSDPEVYDNLYWTWIWGDGTNSSTTGNATVPVSTYGHVWTSLGVFFVNVTVSDGFSGPILCPSPVAVSVVPPQPGTLMGIVLSTNGSPVGDAIVNTTPGDYHTATNASGGFSLAVPAGTYLVTVAAPDYTSETRTGQAVTSGGVTRVDFVLSPIPGVIRGTVTNAAGAALGNVTVVIAPATGQNAITLYRVHTDDRGFYVQMVPSGTYFVTVAAPGYAGQNRSGVYVAPGQTVSSDFTLLPQAAPSSSLSIQALVAVVGVVAAAGVAAFLLRRRRNSS